MKENAFYEVHRWIDHRTPVYPGDPPFTQETLSSVERGDCCTLRYLKMSNHFGTHIDFPAHFVAGGNTRSDYTLQHLMGASVVINIDEAVSIITPEHFAASNITAGDIVFFKTRNSQCHEYRADYTALSPLAAQLLLDKKVKIVGIDGMSVDPPHSTDFPAHQLLLGNGILIVENLMLQALSAGRYFARINPLPIAKLDGVQVTVTLEGSLN